ncbi:AraC family transcriptional regulator [Thioclava atlantica]|uniref:AraC family transcriptional regulator n=1 Tax=Thioclava atlantica TaxID=1317124 RepID=A0A085TX91_9RHOB|nr:AraC family transcriptional regulator [Thioclava atlantica]
MWAKGLQAILRREPNRDLAIVKLFSTPPLSQVAQPAAQSQPRPKAAAPKAGPGAGGAPGGPRVVPVGRLAQGGRWRVEAMRALSEPCLLWFSRGQGRITLGGVTRGYGPNNVIFIPAGVMHGFEVGPQTHGQALFLGRDSDLVLPHAAHHLRIRDAVAQGEINVLFEAIQREIEGGRPASDRALRNQLGLLSVWLERQIEAHAGEAIPTNAARRLVSRYSALVERDFRSGAGVGELARELGVTPTHLTRACREACGKSALELLQERRLYEARRMLRDTPVPVKEIAKELGYTSPAYFTRVFHARTGSTPRAFRRSG